MTARQTTALVLVDVINPMTFPEGESFAARTGPVAGAITCLRRAAHRAGAPVVYANDNYGDWSASLEEIVRRCTRPSVPGATFTRRVRPTKRDLFVLKARNSGFYCTALEPLLESYGVTSIVLAGLTCDNCVLFTANDAYLRGYRVVIARDAVLSEDEEPKERALAQMKECLKAAVVTTSSVRFTVMRSL